MMQHRISLGVLALTWGLTACAPAPTKKNATQELIDQQMRDAVAQRGTINVPPAVSQALLMPGASEQPVRPPEPRFNLAVNNAPAAQVFTALGAGSRYSFVVPPDVAGSLSLNLKNVTMAEALDTIREAYGYDFRVTEGRVIVQPQTLQSRVFKLNYLAGVRQGQTDTQVVSGSIVKGGTTVSNLSNVNAQANGAPATTTQSQTSGASGAVVQTSNKADFWADLSLALRTLVGEGEGRSVVVSPQSGVIIVRAMPAGLRNVESFIRLSQLSLERQVMLEAKIVEVELSDGYQNGINWTALMGGRARVGTGLSNSQVNVPSVSFPDARGGSLTDVYNSETGSYQQNNLANLIATPIVGSLTGRIAASPLADVLGFTFASGNFNAILSFLETQGGIHVMSSPRIATVNNQKAVLKVGSDDYFVTNISTTVSTSAAGNLVTPSIELQPFFSGISLDVMPQIDDDGEHVMLHIRPSVSNVTERSKTVNLGNLGSFVLPLASSSANETDSIVRVREGNIVAIGGLMQQIQTNDSAKVPGFGDVPVVGELFSQGRRATKKRELVVLLKATIISSDKVWQNDLSDTAARLSGLQSDSLGPKLLPRFP